MACRDEVCPLIRLQCVAGVHCSFLFFLLAKTDDYGGCAPHGKNSVQHGVQYCTWLGVLWVLSWNPLALQCTMKGRACTLTCVGVPAHFLGIPFTTKVSAPAPTSYLDLCAAAPPHCRCQFFDGVPPARFLHASLFLAPFQFSFTNRAVAV